MVAAAELIQLFAVSRNDPAQQEILQRLVGRLCLYARGAEVHDLTSTLLRLVQVNRDLRERLAAAGQTYDGPPAPLAGATAAQWVAVGLWLYGPQAMAAAGAPGAAPG
jgi:hypothetical protein